MTATFPIAFLCFVPLGISLSLKNEEECQWAPLPLSTLSVEMLRKEMVSIWMWAYREGHGIEGIRLSPHPARLKTQTLEQYTEPEWTSEVEKWRSIHPLFLNWALKYMSWKQHYVWRELCEENLSLQRHEWQEHAWQSSGYVDKGSITLSKRSPAYHSMSG